MAEEIRPEVRELFDIATKIAVNEQRQRGAEIQGQIAQYIPTRGQQVAGIARQAVGAGMQFTTSMPVPQGDYSIFDSVGMQDAAFSAVMNGLEYIASGGKTDFVQSAIPQLANYASREASRYLAHEAASIYASQGGGLERGIEVAYDKAAMDEAIARNPDIAGLSAATLGYSLYRLADDPNIMNVGSTLASGASLAGNLGAGGTSYVAPTAAAKAAAAEAATAQAITAGAGKTAAAKAGATAAAAVPGKMVAGAGMASFGAWLGGAMAVAMAVKMGLDAMGPKLHAGERTFGMTMSNILESAVQSGNAVLSDPQIALAMSRLQLPDTGADSAGDAIDVYMLGVLPGTGKAGGSPEVDQHTIAGFNKMISLGMITPEALDDLFTHDLGYFRGKIGQGVSFNDKRLQPEPSQKMINQVTTKLTNQYNRETVPKLQETYNAFFNNPENRDSLTSSVQDALREAGRGDVRFNASALRPINIGGDDEGSNEITSPDQYIAAVRNQLARAFLVNDGNDDLPMNPQALEGLMNRIPKLRQLLGPVMAPSQPQARKLHPIESYSKTIKEEEVLDQPVEEVDPVEQKLIQNVTESVTSFADAGKRGEQRSPGLPGVGSFAQNAFVAQEQFVDRHLGNPLVQQMLTEEIGRAGRPYENPDSPWYDPERAAKSKPTMHSMIVGINKTMKRFEEMGMPKPLEAAVPKPQPQSSQEATGGIFSPSQAEEYRQEEVVQRMQEKASHTGSFGSSVFGINEIPQDIFSRLNVHAQKRLREGGKVPLNLAYYGY